jgi:hypothetical protein
VLPTLTSRYAVVVGYYGTSCATCVSQTAYRYHGSAGIYADSWGVLLGSQLVGYLKRRQKLVRPRTIDHIVPQVKYSRLTNKNDGFFMHGHVKPTE